MVRAELAGLVEVRFRFPLEPSKDIAVPVYYFVNADNPSDLDERMKYARYVEDEKGRKQKAKKFKKEMNEYWLVEWGRF